MHLARRLLAARSRGPERPRKRAPSSASPPARRTLDQPLDRRRPRAFARGQAVVEFALLVPVFMLLLVVALDFGRLFFTYVQIHNAAREGAAFAVYTPTDTVGITTRANGEKNGQAQRGENAITVSATCADAAGTSIPCSAAQGGTGPGNSVTVVVDEPFTFLTPTINGFFGGSLRVKASATAAVLGYAASTGGSGPGTCSAPTASFVWTITSGRTIFANPSASTPNSGVCNISGYNWTWGDTTTDVGTATGDSHTFVNDGTYLVSLEVTNQGGTDTQTQSVVISSGSGGPSCAKPTANFQWTKSGPGNKTYTYVDKSTVADDVNCPITDWLWTFTDLGGLQSNAKNPASVTYANGSNHPVTLKVTNLGGSTTITLNT